MIFGVEIPVFIILLWAGSENSSSEAVAGRCAVMTVTSQDVVSNEVDISSVVSSDLVIPL